MLYFQLRHKNCTGLFFQAGQLLTENARLRSHEITSNSHGTKSYDDCKTLTAIHEALQFLSRKFIKTNEALNDGLIMSHEQFKRRKSSRRNFYPGERSYSRQSSISTDYGTDSETESTSQYSR